MLYAARSITHARVALHALQTYPSPASQHVRRHACGDKSRIGSSAEPAWRMLGAQQLSSSISAARRLLSLPATRAHPAHSAQADWAGSTHLHTFHAHGHRPCRSFSYGEPWFYPAQSRPRSTFRLASRWLDDAPRASSNHAPAARSGRTAVSRAGENQRSETYHLEFSDPAHLGLDPAKSQWLPLPLKFVLSAW